MTALPDIQSSFKLLFDRKYGYFVFTNQCGAKECPEWDEEVSARDAGKVEQRVGDAGTRQDPEEAHPLHELLDAVLGSLEPGHLLGVLQLLLQLQELLLLLAGLAAGQSRGPRHEVGRQLPDGGARAPAEGLHPHLGEDGPHGHLHHAGHGLRTRLAPGGHVTGLRAQNLAGVGRLGELEAVALVAGHGDGGDVRAEVEEEGVEAGAEADRAEDAEADPPGAPGEVLLPGVDLGLVGGGGVVEGGQPRPQHHQGGQGQPVPDQGRHPLHQGQHQLAAAVLQHPHRAPGATSTIISYKSSCNGQLFYTSTKLDHRTEYPSSLYSWRRGHHR